MRRHRTRLSRKIIRLSAAAACLALPLAAVAGPYPPALVATSVPDPLQRAEENALWLELEGFERPAATARASTDLLERLRRGFTLEPVMNAKVKTHLDWYARHPEYLERVFTRAQRYMPYIVEELERRNMPLELALLPIVESAYDPFAYSHGRAAGLWQIIPGTARRLGLRQNWWYDGRRDVVDSTRAALDYLQYLHDLLDGDWLLAVAGYNAGGGGVSRAIKRNLARSQPTDFWHLSLPRETSGYVPRLLALAEIVRDPAAYGVTLPELVDAPQFVPVEIGGQLDLALAAELAGLDLDTLYAFNSGFNRWATDPEGEHRLLLPADVADAFAAALAAVPDEERIRWQRHKVRPGEAISQIARRYHTTVEAIRAANGLSGNLIRAGDWLTIPVATKPLSAYAKSADARLAATQNRQREGRRVEHVVAPGESFWSISRRFGVGVRELAAWNGMAPGDPLAVGRKLVVWTSDPNAAASGPGGRELTRKLSYTVRRGDSLYQIAQRFRVTVADLVRWNGIDRDNVLRPGQKLTMYVDVTRQSS
ncbi:MAG TPA: LysM peptidoglycan-binding domain-containing protein [Woeseiaceae bacterium]|nr:LysM peptidoglycan-binding domain-containing protein [Woeseiaceae bacterium]